MGCQRCHLRPSWLYLGMWRYPIESRENNMPSKASLVTLKQITKQMAMSFFYLRVSSILSIKRFVSWSTFCYFKPNENLRSSSQVQETYIASCHVSTDTVQCIVICVQFIYNFSNVHWTHCLGMSYYVNILGGLGSNGFHIKWRFGSLMSVRLWHLKHGGS